MPVSAKTIECGLAAKESARAYYFDGLLVFVIKGSKPSPCWEVSIEKSPLDVEPPQFAVRQCRVPGFCPQVVTPYAASQIFDIGVYRKEIVLHHAAGTDTVQVQQVTDADAKSMMSESAGSGKAPGKDLGEIPIPFLIPPSSKGASAAKGGDEASGRSNSFSFEDAFWNAIKALPSGRNDPDKLTRIVVAEIGAEFGGLAGFSHMYVRVRRVPDSLRT